MFEVLVYVYENYWRADACPEWPALTRKLSAVGFEPEDIADALNWLEGLDLVARSTHTLLPEARTFGAASSSSLRIYAGIEQEQLGAQALGFVTFLESAGVLPPFMREIVIERAMATGASPLPLEALKIIVLMVYWQFGEEPDSLVLDELCEDEGRVGH